MNTLNKRHKSKFTSRCFGLKPSSGVQIKFYENFICSPDEGVKPKRHEVNLLLCLLFNLFILLFIIKFILPAEGPLYKLLTMKEYIYIYIYIKECVHLFT